MIKKKIIKVKIISNYQNKFLEQKINYEISKDNENEATEIEIYNTELISTLIKKYCTAKLIKSKNLYLTKNDLKKIKNNISINEAKIKNNETIFIFEGNENKENGKNNDEKEEIKFEISYQDNNYSIIGFKNFKFSDCIKSFIKEKDGEDFIFIYKEEIIDKNKTLDELNIKNGDIIKVEN